MTDEEDLPTVSYGFASNPKLIKSPGIKIEYTPEMIQELKICSKDPIYFIERYVRIQHPILGDIPFKMYDFQKRIIRSYLSHRWNVVLTSRQIGKTVTSACYLLWYAIFRFDSNILITSRRNSDAMDIVTKVRYAYEGLPDWLRPGAREYSKHVIAFDNGSRISAEATTENTGRGQAITILYLDEFAFVPPGIAEQFWTSITPTLSCLTGGTMVLTSQGYRKIKDFHKDREIGEYFSIPNLKCWGREGMERVSHGYVSPESETLIVRTKKGIELEATLNHPLLKLSSTGPQMTPTKNLKIGDSLRIDVGMNIFGDNPKIDEEFAYLLGGYIAEGWMHKRGDYPFEIYISNTDADFRDKFLNSSIIKGFRQDSRRKDKLRCGSRELIKRFIEVGVDPFAKWTKLEAMPKGRKTDLKERFIINNETYIATKDYSGNGKYIIQTPKGEIFEMESNISAPFFDTIDILVGKIKSEYKIGTRTELVYKDVIHEVAGENFAPNRYKKITDKESYDYNTRLTYLV